MGLFANTEPSAEDLERLLSAAATYDEPDVIDALLFAYRLGCINGNAQGEKFGTDMIEALRQDGAFK